MAFRIDTPWNEPERGQRRIVLYGSGSEMVAVRYTNQYGRARTYETAFEGVIPNLERRYSETSSDYIRQMIEQYMTEQPLPRVPGQAPASPRAWP